MIHKIVLEKQKFRKEIEGASLEIIAGNVSYCEESSEVRRVE